MERLLLPSTIVLREDGVLEIFPTSSVAESTRIKGSLSPREIGSILSDRLELSLVGQKCGFSVRKVWRSMEVLDRDERKLLKHLDVDLSETVRERVRHFSEVYLARLLKNGREYVFIADRKSIIHLKNYLVKYCLLERSTG